MSAGPTCLIMSARAFMAAFEIRARFVVAWWSRITCFWAPPAVVPQRTAMNTRGGDRMHFVSGS